MVMYLTYNTEFGIDKEKEELFIDYMLDGQRYFHYKNGVPQFALGRSTYQATGGQYIYKSLERLVQLDGLYRQEDLQRYYNSFDDENLIDSGIEFFPVVGTLVYKSPEGYMAVRGCPDGISMTDVQNREGVLNYNYSYGSNSSYMSSGNEYSLLGAVYDYSMVPGTTTYYEHDDELYKRWETEYNLTWGHLDHVKRSDSNCDGVVDKSQNAGMMVTELHHDGINGKNVFILYDGSLYCLGMGYNANDSEGKIITTIDQCVAEDSSTYQKSIPIGETFVNAGFSYTNLCDTPMNVENRMQKGTISRTVLNFDDDKIPIQESMVFVCYYDWGDEMDDVSYCYKVSPMEHTSTIEITNIINCDECQVIEFSDGMVIGYVYDEKYEYHSNVWNMTLDRGLHIMKSVEE